MKKCSANSDSESDSGTGSDQSDLGAQARLDVRAIDRETAIQVLHCIDRYVTTRLGDVKKLRPPLNGFRLRCGDYRVFFDNKPGVAIEVAAVLNRRQAYP